MLRILIADDHTVVRKGLKQILLEEFPTAHIEDVPDAEEMIKKIMDANWDVVVSDMSMPGRSGLDALQQIKQIYPDLPVLILSIHPEEHYALRVLKAGASGYLLKHESYHTILQAIQEVLEFGGAPMSPAIARKTLKILGKRKQTEHADTSVIESLLTEREFEILQHLVNGYDAKRIAEITGISTLTVRKHIANVYTKLHVNSKAQVISMAHKNNWV